MPATDNPTDAPVATIPATKRRKRRRGGRRRKAGRREPSGKLSRRIEDQAERAEMTREEAMAPMLDARQRQTGLPRALLEINDAGKPNAGTVHGMMRLRGILAEQSGHPLQPGMLSADQWEAADWYIGKRTAWLRAIDAPGQPIDIPEVPPVRDPQRQAEWCRLIRQQWAEITACLQEASTVHRTPIIAAFDVLLVRNQYLEHMDGDLRIGLNAIHRTFLAGRRQTLTANTGAR